MYSLYYIIFPYYLEYMMAIHPLYHPLFWKDEHIRTKEGASEHLRLGLDFGGLIGFDRRM